MSISSIDELLMGDNSKQQTEVNQDDQYQDALAPITEEYEEPNDTDDSNEPDEPEQDDQVQQDKYEEEKPKRKEAETDEYGNEKEVENEAIRERLARQARKHQAEIDSLRSQLEQQGASLQVQQAAKDFEYNPEEGGDWQQQLASFVKQTVNSMTREQSEVQSQQQERQAQAEFESKFRSGMDNFGDFVDVMSNLPFQISNPMTLATRAMDNPAAFLYAAAKRNPQELERISKIRDPYVQMTEMGRLEERMKRNKPVTKAPRPLGRAQEDATTNIQTKKKDVTGDDLLANADAKRLNIVKTRHKGNR